MIVASMKECNEYQQAAKFVHDADGACVKALAATGEEALADSGRLLSASPLATPVVLKEQRQLADVELIKGACKYCLNE